MVAALGAAALPNKGSAKQAAATCFLPERVGQVMHFFNPSDVLLRAGACKLARKGLPLPLRDRMHALRATGTELGQSSAHRSRLLHTVQCDIVQHWLCRCQFIPQLRNKGSSCCKEAQINCMATASKSVGLKALSLPAAYALHSLHETVEKRRRNHMRPTSLSCIFKGVV
jgi:hypothetical protein